jgi:hypothetical protein
MKLLPMKNKITLLFFLILFSSAVVGQNAERKEISGKINLDLIAIESVNVVNLTTNKSTITDENGAFLLFVKEGDVLVFSAINLVTLRKRVDKQDLSIAIMKLQMVLKSIPLNEVVINEALQISAEKLGIIPYGQKKYTPAERKLYTATSGGGIDGLLNAISGRKAMLKKEILVEKKELSLHRLEYLFEDLYYIEMLKVPQDHIRGFQYYCVEDVHFAAALKVKNKTLSMFLIVALAEKYNQIIENEN